MQITDRVIASWQKKQVKNEPPNTYNVWPKWLMKGILSSDDICYGNMKLSK